MTAMLHTRIQDTASLNYRPVLSATLGRLYRAHIYDLTSGSGSKHCDQHVCISMSACMYLACELISRISKKITSKSMKFSLHYLWSVAQSLSDDQLTN